MAKMVILSMAEYDEALKVASFLRKNYPHIKVLARAKDIYHAFEFFKRNVNTVQEEVFDSAAELGRKALENLGYSQYDAFKATRTFKHHEKQVLLDLYILWKEDETSLIQETRRFSKQLSDILQSEKDYLIQETDFAWDANSMGEETEAENTSAKTKTKKKK